MFASRFSFSFGNAAAASQSAGAQKEEEEDEEPPKVEVNTVSEDDAFHSVRLVFTLESSSIADLFFYQFDDTQVERDLLRLI